MIFDLQIHTEVTDGLLVHHQCANILRISLSCREGPISKYEHGKNSSRKFSPIYSPQLLWHCEIITEVSVISLLLHCLGSTELQIVGSLNGLCNLSSTYHLIILLFLISFYSTVIWPIISTSGES